VKFLPDNEDSSTEVALQLQCQGHPGVVKVVAYYRHVFAVPRQGRYRRLILVLEVLRGGELFDQIRRGGRVDETTAKNLTRQLASVLAHVHARGVVHRDVKLENVLLVNRNEPQPSIKLADFGFASTPDRPRGPRFTPAYISPEVLRQLDDNTERAPPTPASDAWALVRLY
jgi:serine/threonine protein kinase